jgi:hypothetical protein
MAMLPYIYADSLSSSIKYLGECYVTTGNSGIINTKKENFINSRDCNACLGQSPFPLLTPTPTVSLTPDPTRTPPPTPTPTVTPTPTSP